MPDTSTGHPSSRDAPDRCSQPSTVVPDPHLRRNSTRHPPWQGTGCKAQKMKTIRNPDHESAHFSVANKRQTIIKTVMFVAASDYLRNNPPAVFPQQRILKTMTKTALKVSALVLAAVLATGCANTGDIEETANRAAADASAAAAAAEAARAAADRASQAAAAAQSTADQALSAAKEAQACCEANRESMERMFQKSMSK